MLLKACLNGSRPPGSHPELPLTPRALAQDAKRAVEAGAGALHFHPRRHDGLETLEAEMIGLALTAVHTACPGVPVGVSTGAWIEPDAERRLALVQEWEVRPDFAGVNFSETGAPELCQALLEMDIAVEAGLWSADDVHRFLAAGIAERCLRVLIEPIRVPIIAEAVATAQEIERLLDDYHVSAPRLVHDKDATAWSVLEYAISRGYDTRIGMEDTLLLPDGKPAHDNAELVRTAHERIRSATGTA
jgi:uncharacterized protein (DUF849 family)